MAYTICGEFINKDQVLSVTLTNKSRCSQRWLPTKDIYYWTFKGSSNYMLLHRSLVVGICGKGSQREKNKENAETN